MTRSMTFLLVSTMAQIGGFETIRNTVEHAYLRRLGAQPLRDDGKDLEVMVTAYIRDVRTSIVTAAQRGLAKSMIVADASTGP